MIKPLVLIYILVMVALIVGLDVLFFKDQFWSRFMLNLGIVLVFIAFYFRFLN